MDKSSVWYKKTNIRIIPQIITETFCTIKEVCATVKKGKKLIVRQGPNFYIFYFWKIQTILSTITCNKSLTNCRKKRAVFIVLLLPSIALCHLEHQSYDTNFSSSNVYLKNPFTNLQFLIIFSVFILFHLWILT